MVLLYRTLDPKFAPCCWSGVNSAERRSAFKELKYRALPSPVRIILGKVPRHSCRRALGPEDMLRRVESSVEEGDCWTRVFRRSAGWRREADRTPVVRPAVKWSAIDVSYANGQ